MPDLPNPPDPDGPGDPPPSDKPVPNTEQCSRIFA
jgi:hypothetical protein